MQKSQKNPTSSSPRAVVIDCDPGVDDALALTLALRSPELSVRALTTVAGNVAVAHTTRNALALLQALGADTVPVAAGCARPLVRPKGAHLPVHGADGFCGVPLTPPARAADVQHAVGFLASLLAAAPARSITIVALGPLTNLAVLCATYPEQAGRIGELVMMGTSSGCGNVTPFAEFNTWVDPDSAARVLGSPPCPVLIADLQQTERLTLPAPLYEQLRTATPLGASLAAMLDGYTTVDPAIHDVLPVAAVIDPTLVARRRVTVEISTAPDRWRGRSRFHAAGPDAREHRIDAVASFDLDRVHSLIAERVAAPQV